MILMFGKHKGKELTNIANEDPSYIIWLSDESIIDVPDDILESASENLYAIFVNSDFSLNNGVDLDQF